MEILKEKDIGIFKLTLTKIVNSIPGVERPVSYQATCSTLNKDIVLTTWPADNLSLAKAEYESMEDKYSHGTFEGLSKAAQKTLRDNGWSL